MFEIENIMVFSRDVREINDEILYGPKFKYTESFCILCSSRYVKQHTSIK